MIEAGIRRMRLSCAAAMLAALTAGCNTGGQSSTSETNGSQQRSGALGGMIKSGGNRQAEQEPATGNASAGAEDAAAPAGGAGGKPGGNPSPAATASRDNFDRRVRIVNNSNRVISLVQGSPTNQNEWGADRIPNATLAAGQAAVVDFNDNNGECRYDLLVTFDDRSTAEQRDVDICRISEWQAAPGGGSVR